MIRILNAEPLGYCDEARQVLRSIGELHEEALDRDALLTIIGDFDVLIVRLGIQVDREVLEAGHRLRAVVSATTGLDHIDVDYACEKDIAVLSLQGERDFLEQVTATAEHNFALLLAVVRKIPQAYESVKQGEWDRDAFRGYELSGKRLGIVGLGRLGEKVARYGQVFEMKVLAYDPYQSCWLDGVVRCASLDELLRQADILSLHVPLNAETVGMIGRRELARLPAGAVVINTARGAVLDSAALVEALESGHLAGAALDVMEAEHDSAELQKSPLLAYAKTHSNLLITPHIGGATRESMMKTEVFMAQKLKQFLQLWLSGWLDGTPSVVSDLRQ